MRFAMLAARRRRAGGAIRKAASRGRPYHHRSRRDRGRERPRGERARQRRDPARRHDDLRREPALQPGVRARRGEGEVRLQRGADRFFGPRLYYNTLDNTGVFEPELSRARAYGARQRRASGFSASSATASSTATTPPAAPARRTGASRQASWSSTSKRKKAPRSTRGCFRHHRCFTVRGVPDRRPAQDGLLTPYYAQTSQRGFEVGIPYYWNIAPEYDATFTPVFMGKRGYQLKSEARYLGRPYAGELRYEITCPKTARPTPRAKACRGSIGIISRAT